MTPKLLLLEEAAEILRVSPTTLAKWVRQRKVEAIRFGQRQNGGIRFSEQQIERMIESLTVGTLKLGPCQQGNRRKRNTTAAAPGTWESVLEMAYGKEKRKALAEDTPKR